MDITGGVLYVIASEGTPLVKIGCTHGSAENRLSTLQVGHPFTLYLLASVAIAENIRAIEKSVHRFLKDARRRGEWFDIAIPDQAALEALVARAVTGIVKQVIEERDEENQDDPASVEEQAYRDEVAWRIRRRRMALGLLQNQLAKRVGIPGCQLSRLEKGLTHSIAIDRLPWIADALHTSLDYLFCRSDNPGELPW